MLLLSLSGLVKEKWKWTIWRSESPALKYKCTPKPNWEKSHWKKVRIPAFNAVFHRPGMQWVWSIYAANPHSIRGLSCNRESRFLLTETARIKQNRAENAKPSQFSRVFSEVSGGLRRDKGIQQALISSRNHQKTLESQRFQGFFMPGNLWWVIPGFDGFWRKFCS